MLLMMMSVEMAELIQCGTCTIRVCESLITKLPAARKGSRGCDDVSSSPGRTVKLPGVLCCWRGSLCSSSVC